MTLGLSMIVKNAAATLRRALEPFRGVADEIVVVDTGSTDETVAILAEFDATVIHDPWRDDFSRARNLALDHATTDWFLSLDADEWVSADDARRLRMLTSGDADAWVIETMNFVTTNSVDVIPTEGPDRNIAPGYVLSSKVRLARGGIRWEGAVHELLDYSARRANYRLSRSEIRIRHDGLFGKKTDDYYESLCRKSYAEGTAHAGIITTLGVIATSRGETGDAERYFREAIAADPILDRPAVWLARLLRRAGKTNEALVNLTDALRRCPPSPDLIFEIISAHRERGEPAAVRVYCDLARKLFPHDPRAGRDNPFSPTTER